MSIQYPVTIREIYSKKLVRRGSNFLIGGILFNKSTQPISERIKVVLEYPNSMYCFGENEIFVDMIDSNGECKFVFECGIHSSAEEAEEVGWKIHLFYLNHKGESRHAEYHSFVTSVAVTYHRNHVPGDVLIISDFILSKKQHDDCKTMFRTLGMPVDFWNIQANEFCVPDWLIARYKQKLIILMIEDSSSLGYFTFENLLNHLNDPCRESGLLVISSSNLETTFLSCLQAACDKTNFFTTQITKEWAERYRWTSPHPDAAKKAANVLLQKMQYKEPEFPYYISSMDFDFRRSNENPSLWYYGTLQISQLPIHKLSPFGIASLSPSKFLFPPLLAYSPLSTQTSAFSNLLLTLSFIPFSSKLKMLLDTSISMRISKFNSHNSFPIQDVIAEAIANDLAEEFSFSQRMNQVSTSKLRLQTIKNFLESSKDYLIPSLVHIQFIIKRLEQLFPKSQYVKDFQHFFTQLVYEQKRNPTSIETEASQIQTNEFPTKSISKPLQK